MLEPGASGFANGLQTRECSRFASCRRSLERADRYLLSQEPPDERLTADDARAKAEGETDPQRRAAWLQAADEVGALGEFGKTRT